jgi:hypothetical protein
LPPSQALAGPLAATSRPTIASPSTDFRMLVPRKPRRAQQESLNRRLELGNQRARSTLLGGA